MAEVVLVACPACEAPNHPDRRRCGRCREPLSASRPASDATEVVPVVMAASDGDPSDVLEVEADTGEVDGTDATDDRSASARVVDLLRGTTPGDTQPLDPVTPSAVEPKALRARPVLVVTLSGLLLGASVGVIAAFGLGSQEDPTGPTVTTVSFEPASYPGEASAVTVSSVGATTFLPPAGDNRYEPDLVLDDDPTTAWNSDGTVRVDGVGEIVTVSLDEPSWITSLELANGYQRDDVRFLANARIARATIVFDGGVRLGVVLLDQTGFQRVPLPEPVLTTSLRIEVTETFPGDTYDDLAVSELRVFGYTATGDDREAAAEIAAQDRAASI